MTIAEEARRGRVSLILGAAFVATVLIGQGCGEGGDPVPAELLGVWSAADPPYAGRTLSIAETTISFSQGEHAYAEHPIVGAEIQNQGSSDLYVVRYRLGDEVQSISLFYEPYPEPLVRLENRAAVRWLWQRQSK